MARPATGWVRYRNGKTGRHWYAQVTLTNGKRSDWLPLPANIPESDRAAAKAAAKIVSDAARSGGYVPRATTAETVNEYATRWVTARTGRVRSVGDNASHLEHHILPVLGPLEMAKLSRADVERLVGALDAKVRAGKLSSKTARNVWGTCSKLLDDAVNAKPAEGLRCLEVDPAAGVRGPDDTSPDKLLQFLYPSELEAFMASPRVTRTWKRNVAIAVYLCLRASEQAALKWSSVDLDHGVVTVQEKYDRQSGTDREGTKTGGARLVRIRPELLPLLRAMHKECGGVGHVCKLPSLQDLAMGLRRAFKRAGVTREALHRATTVSKPLRWHDLRASGATWLAVEGVSPSEIRDVLGHTHTNMTDRYMRAANVLRGGAFGRPFPALPASLGFSAGFASRAKLAARKPLKSSESECEGRELNPYRNNPAGT